MRTWRGFCAESSSIEIEEGDRFALIGLDVSAQKRRSRTHPRMQSNDTKVHPVTTRRVMKSVLRNFLGTYISRYSDYQGYWLFGQLPSDLWEWTIDLLGPVPEGNAPSEAAHRLAIRRFAEQISKSRLALDAVHEATLKLDRSPEVVEGHRGSGMAKGHMVRFVARAVMDNGRVYEYENSVFVAPHDPAKEGRRG